MFKLAVLIFCASTSIFYYSVFNKKSDTDMGIIMAFVRTIKQAELNKDQIDDLLDNSGASEEIKMAVRSNLSGGFVYSKFTKVGNKTYYLDK